MSLEIRKLLPWEMKKYFQLWKQNFHDEPKEILEIWNAFETDLEAFVLFDENEIKAELTLFKMGKIKGSGSSLDNRDVKVSYAICTDKGSRNRGFGSKITEYVKEIVEKEGAISVLCPAESSLVQFYEDLGYIGLFGAKDTLIEAFKPCEDVNIHSIACEKISKEEYSKKRREFLKDRMYVDLTENAMKYVELCAGDIGLLELDGGRSIAACYYSADSKYLEISEFLFSKEAELIPEYGEKIMSELAFKFGKEKCLYYQPQESLGESLKIQCMGALRKKEQYELKKVSSDFKIPWFGFPFS